MGPALFVSRQRHGAERIWDRRPPVGQLILGAGETPAVQRRLSLRAERSNLPPTSLIQGDCFVAALLAMTRMGWRAGRPRSLAGYFAAAAWAALPRKCGITSSARIWNC